MTDAKEKVEWLEAAHPDLVTLLRGTPPGLNADTGSASSDEMLIARALTILGAGRARADNDPAEIVRLTPSELRLMLNGGEDPQVSTRQDVQQLRDEIAGLRSVTLTEDNVRVLVAKMVVGVIAAAAALTALVSAIVHLT